MTGATVTRSNVKSETPQFTVRQLSSRWNGDRVYELRNSSHQVLSHVAIYSWTELLPVVWKGTTEPKLSPSLTASSASPPYDLAPGEQLWFVGPREGPEEFAVEWLNPEGVAEYENLIVNQ